MAYVPVQRKHFLFTPADYTADEVKSLITLPQGAHILLSTERVLEVYNGTSTQVELGVTGVDDDGLVATADVTEGTAGLYQGKGALLVSAAGSPGYTVTTAAGETLAVKFTAGTGTRTTGKSRFTVVFLEPEK